MEEGVIRTLGPLASLTSVVCLSSATSPPPPHPLAEPHGGVTGSQPVAAGEGSSLALQLPACLFLHSLLWLPTAWSFFVGGSSAVVAGLESCLGVL